MAQKRLGDHRGVIAVAVFQLDIVRCEKFERIV